jgi:hypothetical protein
VSRLVPAPDEQALTLFVRSADKGILVIPPPDESGDRCIPVFSERWRAVDYALTLLSTERELRLATMSAEDFVLALRDFETKGSFTFTIDRCPRCAGFATFATRMADSPDYFLRMMVVQKAEEMARRHLYYTYALAKARGSEFLPARDVALETVSHVTMADPNTHLLLGQIGVAMGDDTLVREAHTFLRFFQSDAWDQKLDAVERAGRPDFAGPE